MNYFSAMVLSLFFLSNALAWNGANNPLNFKQDLERNFANLPLSGETIDQNKNWPGYHWPHNKMSINYRWTAGENDQTPRMPGLEVLKKMNRSSMNSLSPAEKFDIYQGRYDYPTVSQAARLSRANASDWNGICHGLAAASKNHPEPNIKTAVNKDGISVSFFSSDLKALLAFEYAKNNKTGVSQIGKRCFFSRNTPIVWRHNSCTDINAGSFHLILTNFLGIKGESFLADLDRFKEVWNHPLKSYSSKVLEMTESRVKIETTILYPDIIDPQFGPLIGTSFDYLKSKTYKYVLYLSSSGEITGGHWISTLRPDFIWIQEKLELNQYLEQLIN